MRDSFLSAGDRATVQSVDHSADEFQVDVEGADGEVLRLRWTEGAGPIFVPRPGARLRLIREAGNPREDCIPCVVLSSEVPWLEVAAEGPPGPLERRRWRRATGPLPVKIVGSPAEADTAAPSDVPPGIARRLDRLEALMEAVAAHLGLAVPPRPVVGALREVRDVSVSASGAALILPSARWPGDVVELDLELPLSPPRAVHASIEVLRCEALDAGAGFLIAGRFDALHEDDRAALVRYVDQRDRELRRTGNQP